MASKGNQRATCGNPFSPFTAWVLRPNAGLQVWWPTPLPAEPFLWTRNYYYLNAFRNMS